MQVVADDYAQHAGIDEAVLALGATGRLHGTSCLVNLPGWPAAARGLAALPGGFSVGWHFNLTEGTPLSAAMRRHWPRLPGLRPVLLRGLVRALPATALADEWKAQLDAFTEAVGRLPDHVDGHQHVHALPQVREHLLASFGSAAPRPAIRSTACLRGPGGRLKQGVIERSGGRALGRALQSRAWPHNPVLLGAYGFGAGEDFRERMRAWMALAADTPRSSGLEPAGAPLLFCHPARHAPPDDPIGPARLREHAYLASEAYAEDWEAAFGRPLSEGPPTRPGRGGPEA